MSMIATLQRKSPRSKEYLLVLVDAREFLLREETVGLCGLRRGDDLDEARIAAVLWEDARERCRQQAWRLLAHGQRTRVELERGLRQRKYDERCIGEVADALQRSGHLDDRAVALHRADRLFRAGRKGPRFVAQSLRQAGVEDELRREAMDTIADRDEQQRLAVEALRRWSGLRRKTDDERKRRKNAGDFLLRRGFDGDVVWAAVKSVLSLKTVGDD